MKDTIWRQFIWLFNPVRRTNNRKNRNKFYAESRHKAKPIKFFFQNKTFRELGSCKKKDELGVAIYISRYINEARDAYKKSHINIRNPNHAEENSLQQTNKTIPAFSSCYFVNTLHLPSQRHD